MYLTTTLVDYTQVARFAYNLGCATVDVMRLRLLLPKNTPEDVLIAKGMAFRPNGGKAVPLPKQGYILFGGRHPELRIQKTKDDRLVDDRRKFAFHYDKGYNAYVVVNQMDTDTAEFAKGQDSDITGGRALFYEIDDIAIAEQWNRLRELEKQLGRSATMVVKTKKSLHCYFTLESPCSVEEWIVFQQRLIQRMNSDPSLWNPARLMRLPGFPYRAYEDSDIRDVAQVEIVEESTNRFTLAEFNGVLPGWDAARWQQKIKSRNRSRKTSPEITIPDPSSFKPYDMRALAQYLPDYIHSGRPGWATARCPVHALNGEHSGDSLHVNHETGGYICHAGCSRQEIWKTIQVIALAAGYTPKQPSKWQGLPWEPDFVCHERYFPTDFSLPKKVALCAVAGAVGVGKSVVAENRVKEARANNRSLRVEAILPRISLERDSAAKYGLTAKNDKSEWKEDVSNVAYCINSVHRAKATPHILIVDEVVQVLIDLFTADTMAKTRSQIIAALREKLIKTMQTGGQVIVLDAHINTPVIKFFMEVMGLERKDVFLANNTHPGQQRTFHISTNERDRNLLINQFDEEVIAGKRLLFMSDSCRTVTERHARLIERGVPKDTILLITSKTADTDAVKAFNRDNKSFLRNNPKLRVIMASPSLQSGVSITTGDFEKGYGFYSGESFNPRTIQQQTARYRPAMDWHIWTEPFVVSRRYQYTESDLLLRDMFHKADAALELLELKEAVARGRKAIAIIADLRNDPFIKCYAELVCQDNFERMNLASEFKSLLERTGQAWVEQTWFEKGFKANLSKKAIAEMSVEEQIAYEQQMQLVKESDYIREAAKETRKALKEEAVKEVLALPLLDREEFEELKTKQHRGQRLSREEYLSIQRHDIEELIAHIPPAERQQHREAAVKGILFEGGKAKLRRLWQLMRSDNTRINCHNKLLIELEKELPWLPDVDFSALELDFYKRSGIYELVVATLEKKHLCFDTPIVTQVRDYILANRNDARMYLGNRIATSQIGSGSSIRLIKDILAVFGIELKRHTTKMETGEKINYHVIDRNALITPWKSAFMRQLERRTPTEVEVKESVGMFQIDRDLPLWDDETVRKAAEDAKRDYRDYVPTSELCGYFYNPQDNDPLHIYKCGSHYCVWMPDGWFYFSHQNFLKYCHSVS
ncbi:MAG: hypothetical protein CLLPBCKN_000437 [Chroococcidiopsis cubana SAG 39.79]|uniref:Replication origin-binding protein domain-containing protein n=1 Tax=Chroococcidiopsis cubana SAG 39.79 TaxID=388085 RepID=A0AB37UA62_9CYAN|nr:DNA/RNA helicase domain-containing protein [Chroococcidiopsis cubana]MDZ4871049.1 hypothetical protein [Chroococcidiopsis cubana SAG 39.79]PSB65582.1 hypothetical protein C7B79_04790 [Chroococcidiopsis cubana CCALA 043]RUT02338.1 hypothetical protein DSM107010_62780 [Chroococcidiopsis cubana SAG 39.79]